jgi:hypothetical protein
MIFMRRQAKNHEVGMFFPRNVRVFSVILLGASLCCVLFFLARLSYFYSFLVAKQILWSYNWKQLFAPNWILRRVD